jgi:hypothetical protein
MRHTLNVPARIAQIPVGAMDAFDAKAISRDSRAWVGDDDLRTTLEHLAALTPPPIDAGRVEGRP